VEDARIHSEETDYSHSLTRRARVAEFRAAQLASAFEVTTAEVLADAAWILTWHGSAHDLQGWLNERHGWHTNEAFYYVRWVRLQLWFYGSAPGEDARVAPDQVEQMVLLPPIEEPHSGS
jgi:hypothetical protein